MPGGFDGVVNELSDILWSIVVVDAEAAKLLLDLSDLDRIISATILFRTPRGCL